MRFPEEVGDLGGLTFEEAFVQCPQWTEFVASTWIEERCSGAFLEYCRYVKARLKFSKEAQEHEMRVREFLKTQPKKYKPPSYLEKYDILE